MIKHFLKKYINILLIIFVASVTLYLVSGKEELKNILLATKKIGIKYVFGAFFAFFVYLFLEALMIHKLLHVRIKTPFWISVKSMFIGQFYSLLTPCASGGQPAQALEMKGDGISSTYAIAVLVNKFLFFQIGVVLYSLVLLIFRFEKVFSIVEDTKGIIVIGFIVNIITLSTLMLAVFNSTLLKKIVNFILGILSFFVKNKGKIEKKEREWNEYIEEITGATNLLFKKRYLFCKLSFYTFLQLGAYFMITYFIYKAFSLSRYSFWDIMLIQSVLFMSMSLVPSPGSVGAAEAGFILFFGNIFKEKTTTALLIWRGITYYFDLIISAFMILLYGFLKQRQKKQEALLKEKICIIGLTGGICSGKSTASSYFKDHGIEVIDADKISAKISQEKETEALILENFGEDLLENGKLNRKRLSEIVFNSQKSKNILESILHPKIIKEIKQKIVKLYKQKKKIVILDIPLLFEKGLDNLCTEVLLIDTSTEIQLERMSKRNAYSDDLAKKILLNQMDISEKRKLANEIICNNGTVKEFYKELDKFIEKIKSKKLLKGK